METLHILRIRSKPDFLIGFLGLYRKANRRLNSCEVTPLSWQELEDNNYKLSICCTRVSVNMACRQHGYKVNGYYVSLKKIKWSGVGEIMIVRRRLKIDVNIIIIKHVEK